MEKKKQKNIGEFFRRNYCESWKFLKESRNFIYAIIGIFLLFSIFGFVFTPSEEITNQIVKFIQEILEKTKDMSQGELTKFIFFNNAQTSFFGMMLGVFLGFFPIILAVLNGYIIGFISSMSVDAEGIFSLWRLLPHGIFELPAVFISLGLGLKIGSFVLQKNKMKSLKKYFLNSFRVFIFVVIPLLIIAAIIEGALIALVK